MCLCDFTPVKKELTGRKTLLMRIFSDQHSSSISHFLSDQRNLEACIPCAPIGRGDTNISQTSLQFPFLIGAFQNWLRPFTYWIKTYPDTHCMLNVKVCSWVSVGFNRRIQQNFLKLIHTLCHCLDWYCILTINMHYASSLVNYCDISHEFGNCGKPDQIMLKEMSYLQSFDVSFYQ